eukprot:5268610-Prorocentrum_lima.AAC.1
MRKLAATSGHWPDAPGSAGMLRVRSCHPGWGVGVRSAILTGLAPTLFLLVGGTCAPILPATPLT